jgi:hypothetical protein
MPVYQHFQEAKTPSLCRWRNRSAPVSPVAYWAVEAPRPEEEVDMVGLCVSRSSKTSP